MTFICPVCHGEFTEKRSLVRHLKNQHGNLWSCSRCNQFFNRFDNYSMHERMVEKKFAEEYVKSVIAMLSPTIPEWNHLTRINQ